MYIMSNSLFGRCHCCASSMFYEFIGNQEKKKNYGVGGGIRSIVYDSVSLRRGDVNIWITVSVNKEYKNKTHVKKNSGKVITDAYAAVQMG